MIRYFIFFILSLPLFGSVPYDPNGPNTIGYLRLEIDRSIDTSTYLYVKFGLEHFRKAGAKFVILDLNTPGGEVFAAQKISRLLHESDALHGMPVVAYLNNWALSAGAMLAYSCRYIAISPSASMGAAEPVMMKSDGMESAPEKINSALRAEFANTAALFGRDPLLAEAMVDKDLILIQREGRFIKLEREEDVLDGDRLISKAGKLLTLNAKQIEEFGLAQFQVPVSQEGIFSIAPFKEIPGVSILQFNNWKINFFSFLSHPAVASLLTLGLMLGLYLEANAPGHGTGALIALSCLGALLLSNFADSALQSFEMILMILGAGLILVELFLFPTAGVLLLLGGVFLLGGLFSSSLPDLGPVHFSLDMDQWNLAAFALYQTLGWISALICSGILLIWILNRSRSRLFNHFVLKEESIMPPVDIRWPAEGSLGQALIPCKPAGKVVVNGEVFEAVAERGFIDKGERVTIVAIDSGRLIIRPQD